MNDVNKDGLAVFSKIVCHKINEQVPHLFHRTDGVIALFDNDMKELDYLGYERTSPYRSEGEWRVRFPAYASSEPMKFRSCLVAFFDGKAVDAGYVDFETSHLTTGTQLDISFARTATMSDTIEAYKSKCADWKQTKLDPIIEAVREDLHRRSQLGIAKYGTTLADNPADHKAKLQHAYEEALDGANYLKWAILELERGEVSTLSYATAERRKQLARQLVTSIGAGKLVGLGPTDMTIRILEELAYFDAEGESNNAV